MSVDKVGEKSVSLFHKEGCMRVQQGSNLKNQALQQHTQKLDLDTQHLHHRIELQI